MQQRVKRLGIGDVAGVSALAHHHLFTVGQRGVQFGGTNGGHQQIISRADNQYRAANTRHIPAEIRLLKRLETLKQIRFSLKVGEGQRLFRFHSRRTGRHPVGGIEEQRLRFHPGLCTARVQQAFADLETAASMGVQLQPAVD
ncbi:hypothetical protein D3C86_1627810 [compost metagenome]